MSMKTLIMFIVGCSVLLAATDNRNCYINNGATVVGTAGAGTLRLQLKCQGCTVNFNVDMYADDPSMTSTTDVVHFTGQTGTIVFTPSSTPFGTGTINYQDGQTHRTYWKILADANNSVDVPCTTGNGTPYTWNVAGGVLDFFRSLYTLVSSVGATNQNLALVANMNDPYSIGQSSGGNLQYMVNGTSIYDNGVIGYYGKMWGVPLSHVHVVSVTVANTITKAAMDTAYAAMSPALGSGEQYTAVGWAFPYMVTGGIVINGPAGPGGLNMSITAYFTNGGTISATTVTSSTGVVTQGQSVPLNQMFGSNSKNPFTDFGIRPAFLLAYLICSTSCGTTMDGLWTTDFTTAKTAIDASFAATLTNPTAGKVIVTSNSGSAVNDSNHANSSTLGYGTNKLAPVSLGIVSSTVVETGTFSDTGILAYNFANGTINTAATPLCQSGVGYGVNYASFTGTIDGASQHQTQAPYWMLRGCAFGAGSVAEPFGLIMYRYPDIMMLVSGYTRGMSAVEAAYNTTYDTTAALFVGDPLNHPFSPNNPPAGGTTLFGNYIFSAGYTAQ